MTPDQIALYGLISCFTLLTLLGIWNNWIWIGKDGYMLDPNLRPGFLKFWLQITPLYLVGRRTGMEKHTL